MVSAKTTSRNSLLRAGRAIYHSTERPSVLFAATPSLSAAEGAEAGPDVATGIFTFLYLENGRSRASRKEEENTLDIGKSSSRAHYRRFHRDINLLVDQTERCAGNNLEGNC